MLEAIADVLNVPMGYFLTQEEQDKKLKTIYKTYNLSSTEKRRFSEYETLYVSRCSGDMKADEVRKFLHETIDNLSDSDLEFFKDFTLRMKK